MRLLQERVTPNSSGREAVMLEAILAKLNAQERKLEAQERGLGAQGTLAAQGLPQDKCDLEAILMEFEEQCKVCIQKNVYIQKCAKHTKNKMWSLRSSARYVYPRA